MVTTGRITFSHILCPTALSMDSDDALRYAIALTQAYDSSLEVCHCIEPTGEPEERVRRAKKMLEASIRSHLRLPGSRNCNWTKTVLVGEPATAITREAAERRTDLIVMRSRRRPHTAALLGSTAD